MPVHSRPCLTRHVRQVIPAAGRNCSRRHRFSMVETFCRKSALQIGLSRAANRSNETGWGCCSNWRICALHAMPSLPRLIRSIGCLPLTRPTRRRCNDSSSRWHNWIGVARPCVLITALPPRSSGITISLLYRRPALCTRRCSKAIATLP